MIAIAEPAGGGGAQELKEFAIAGKISDTDLKQKFDEMQLIHFVLIFPLFE